MPWQIALEWGESQVKIRPGEECMLFGETYKAGLLLKHIPPANLMNAITPMDLMPFVKAKASLMPSFRLMICHHAQDTIQVHQHMQIVHKEQRGLVGHICNIEFDQVGVVPEDNQNTPVILVPL